MVWHDYRNGYADIYGYHLSTQTEFPICTDPASQWSPAISGDIVVWEDKRNGWGDIYGYDLSTGTEFPICTDPARQENRAISAEIVVWEDRRNDDYDGDIYGYDLSTQTEFPICTDPAGQCSPAISGDIVVWYDGRNDSVDIYGYDLSTQTEFPICTHPARQENPAISGDIVVWLDNRAYVNGNHDIYAYDLSTQTELAICTHPARQENPAVSGDIVVWEDKRNGNEDIYGYELCTQTEFPLNTNPASQWVPAISDNIVIWSASEDIYGQQFAQPVGALQVHPSALLFYLSGSTVTPAAEEITITKVGSGVLDWAASADIDWLNLNPILGAAPSTMNVSVDFANLAGDSYTGHITVVGSTPGSVNSPQTVTVNIGAGREVSGTIDVDTTWTMADSSYIVSGDVIVNNGVTLTIEHGVGVIFEASDILSSGQDPDKTELIVKGTLVADGITFTSHAGESTAGDWYGIRFLDSSVDWDGNAGSTINNSTIEYATVGISTDGASPMISNNTITSIKADDADLDTDADDGTVSWSPTPHRQR